MVNDLNKKILPRKQKELFELFSNSKWISRFYLAGGTALALQIGHRQSIDFDFFSTEIFDTKKIIKELNGYSEFELFSEAKDTLHGLLNGVQLSFFRLEDKLLDKTICYNELKIASMLDIATMKINAISGRGSKKDFIDLYFLLDRFSLTELLNKYKTKYGKSVSNNYHLLKSLTYFEDAEKQPMPKMLVDVSWANVKKSIVNSVRKSQII